MTRTELASLWGDYKQQLIDTLTLTNDALHVHISVILYLLFALILRKPLRSPWPWLLVLLAELGNEWVDLQQPVGNEEANWAASWHDIKNTMFIPSLILLFAWVRRLRWLKPRS